MMLIEQWRDVIGYEGSYQVSSIGRARSVDRICSNGGSYKGRMLRLRFRNAGGGYLAVSLSKKGVVKARLVHSLVLESFVGPCPENEETRHLDGDSLNNSITNLCWGTRSENVQDSIRHGTKYVRAVRRSDGKEFSSLKAAAESCDGNCPNIQKVCAGSRPRAYGYSWEYMD